MINKISWIALDWGTTNLRAYALDENNKVLEESFSTKGMASLKPSEFEPALLELITAWLPETGKIRVLACGMVGARQGWLEAPYQSVPCSPYEISTLVPVETSDVRIEVSILPGVNQLAPADVMRGEETQIAGFMESQSIEITKLCLPGTHSKWVSLVDGNIAEFSTYMTGEMFNILCEHSVLRYSVESFEWNNRAYTNGVTASLDAPEDLLNSCFRLRAESLLNDMGAGDARSYLSGLLIGAEIASTKRYWREQSVALVGDLRLTKLYADALKMVDVKTELLDPKALTLAGLCRVYRSLDNQKG